MADPVSIPWARLVWTMAEMFEDSSVRRRTVDVVAPHSMICPMTPLDAVTGMPTAKPELVPLSMVTVEDHESVEPEMTCAASDWS